MFEIGDVLKVSYSTFNHYGIYTGNGIVIHNSKKYGCVEEISIDEFSDNRLVEVSTIQSSDPVTAVYTAQRYLGLPYGLFSENCEHFVRMACGVVRQSTQVQKYLIAALGIGALIRSDNTLIKAAGGAAVLATLLTPSEQSPVNNAAVASCLAAGIAYLSED